MKLVAIWVEKYMRIENQGFNFGSKYTYDFQYNTQQRELKVTAEETLDYYQLFPQTGITNITGLVGINGAGKTTLLKLLNVIEANKPIEFPVVVVFENTLNGKIEITQYINTSAIVDSPAKIKLQFNDNGIISRESIEEKKVVVIDNENPFKNTDIIFYSNLYSDQNDRYLSLNNKLNRSVDYQSRQSLSPEKLRVYLDNHTENKDGILADESFNVLKLYQNDKLKRLLNFLVDVNSNHIEIRAILNKISFPSYITIEFNNVVLNHAQSTADNSLYNFTRITDVFNYCMNTNATIKSIKTRLKNEIIYKIFFYVFYNDSFKQSNRPHSLTELEDLIQNISLDKSIFSKLKSYVLSHNNNNEFYTISKVNTFLTNIDDILNDISIEAPSFFDFRSYKITINDHLWKLLNSLLEIVEYEYEELFRYSLNPFSAGEAAMLNQFSEYYEAINTIFNREVIKDNVIISIDEGELYLHPEWQRQYLNSLYLFFDYFNTKLTLNKNLQFIITSHSPYIVSDIPKHNLIFLSKDDKGHARVSNSHLRKATFGGNIFELFNDAFYTKGFIGEFAFNKINEAISFLTDRKSTFTELVEVEKFIKLIGEPLIREELEKIIKRKKSVDFDKYFETIKIDQVEITETPKKNRKKK